MSMANTKRWNKLCKPEFGNEQCGLVERTPILIDKLPSTLLLYGYARKYLKLKRLPSKDVINIISFMYSAKELILSPKNDNHIWKFNIETKTWSKHRFSRDKMVNHAQCISDDQKTLFIMAGSKTNHRKLMKIDIDTMRVQIVSSNIPYTAMMIYESYESHVSHCVYRDETHVQHLIHIIGGGCSNKHFLVDNGYLDMRPIHIFGKKLCDAGIVYIKRKQEFLLFHGSIPIHKYSIQTMKWTNTNVSMPANANVEGFGYIKTWDEKYVIIFGGRHCGEETDIILIYDRVNELYSISPVRTPIIGNMNAVLTKEGNIHLFSYDSHYTIHINNILNFENNANSVAIEENENNENAEKQINESNNAENEQKEIEMYHTNEQSHQNESCNSQTLNLEKLQKSIGYSGYKRKELESECIKHNLPKKGSKKQVLRDRLLLHYKEKHSNISNQE
eukprot:11211_1